MARVKFEDYSIEVKEALGSAVAQWLEEASGEVEARAKRNTPVGNGDLKGKWEHKVDASEQKAIVGNPLENAIWNEFGTGAYALNGNGRSTPWYVAVEGYVGKKKPTYNGKVVIVYGKNGKQFFKTNGKKPQRSLQKAYDSLKNKLQKSLENRLKRLS